MSSLKTHVLVVGAGPGGYVAAIRAGQLGLKTVLVDVDRLGGTCLIRGCIPSKALIHAAEQFETVRRAAAGNPLGISVATPPVLDMAQTIRWKDEIVDKLSGGVGGLLRRAKVDVVPGWASFSDARTCVVQGEGEPVTITAEHVILATGSTPVQLTNLPFGGDVISSTEALDLAQLPKRLAVVGAGYIGLELGLAFTKLGCDVTVIEAKDRILPQYDAALSRPVAKALTRAGIALHLNTVAQGYAHGALVLRDKDGAITSAAADKVLITIGRRPCTEGFGLERMAVDLAGPFIKVDDRCATSMRGVWAIGDVVGEPMLAHKASAQGEMVAEVIAGKRRRFEPAAIPAVCFTDPEIVTVGLQPDAVGEGAQVATFPLSASGRALSMESDGDEGFIRVVAGGDHRILGFAAVGRNVSELSGEMTALIEMGAVLEDVGALIHAHPTLSEGIGEASLRALGHAIHV